MIWRSKYFCGHEISRYGQERGYVDFGTLSKAGDMVLCNRIADLEEYLIENLINGDLGYDGCSVDIYQWWIISDPLKNILCEYTDELVFYSELLDCYVWGITHWGTAWDYVLTNIRIELED